MKNKKYNQLYKLLKTGKSHAGFTLVELLSGLIMSTIVIGGLGYGLFQLTRATRDESNKITARNETSRAMDFISDEVRRARNIELIDLTTGEIADLSDAPTYNPPNDGEANEGTPRLALEIPDVNERIIYSVSEPVANSPWQGPLVLYRWGPNLDAAGVYTNSTNPGAWSNEPLIDGLDDEDQDVVCGTTDGLDNGPDNTITYQGFFACVTDNDNDGISEVEDELAGDTNGNGVIDDDEDELAGDTNGNGVIDDDDRDELSVTAQLYFASGIDIANTDDDKKYGADTQVVARARVRDTTEEEDEETTPISFRTLAAEYSLGIRGGDAVCNGKKSWTMRTEFFNDSNLGNAGYSTSGKQPKQWIHDPNRQGQQIQINTSVPLTIASIPIGYGSCTGNILSRGNQNLGEETYFDEDDFDGDGDKLEIHPNYPYEKVDPYSSWTPKAGIQSSDFTIDFSDPTTFNGNKEGESDYDNPNIGVDHVKVYKNGSIVASYPGYDDNNVDDPNTTDDDPEQSLKDFLVEKGYAEADGGNIKIKGLKDNERIIAVEIGQVLEDGSSLITFSDGTDNPGFDLQDSVFILSTDKFDKKYPASDF